MYRDRNVGTPASVPDPHWENVWCRPSAVTTLWPACAPPLHRTTTSTGRVRQSQSTVAPFPSSPKPRPPTQMGVMAD